MNQAATREFSYFPERSHTRMEVLAFWNRRLGVEATLHRPHTWVGESNANGALRTALSPIRLRLITFLASAGKIIKGIDAGENRSQGVQE